MNMDYLLLLIMGMGFAFIVGHIIGYIVGIGVWDRPHQKRMITAPLSDEPRPRHARKHDETVGSEDDVK